MLRTVTVSVLLLCICALVSGDVVFTRSRAPAGWEMGRRALPKTVLTFQFGLKQQHLDVLEAKFWAVSDPKSPEYQHFMSIEDIGRIVAPKAGDVEVVTEWLLLHGVKAANIKPLAGDSLEVTATVAVAEKLFETQFFHFEHLEEKTTVVRQFGSFSMPSAVRSRVALIEGVAQFPAPRTSRLGGHVKDYRNVPNANPYGVIAQTVYSLYNIGPESFGNATSTSQGVVEFQGEYFSPDDLQEYATLTGIKITPLTADHIVGTNEPYGQTEATLDIQLVSTVNTEATNWFWIEDNNGWLWQFATHFFNTTTVPNVVSISYGWWEGDQCRWDTDYCTQSNITDDQYTARVNTEFQKIALRGITIVASSGDSGAHTRSDEDCSAPTLYSDFPGSSPYVLSVGATQIQPGTGKALATQPAVCHQDTTFTCLSGGTEQAVTLADAYFTSGGGFSEVADMPDYQTAAVKAYLASGVTLPPPAMYNSSKRARPDVSAQGNNVLIYQDSVLSTGGTSASSPIWAAIISLLNQASIKKSGQPLGFVNTLLYQIAASTPSAFNDITVGDNICPEAGCSANCKGWVATKGWDPVTGLGTPNYGALLNYILTH